jgi:hypothetical protein
MALVSTQPLTGINTGISLGGKEQPARKTDYLTTICEPIV